MNGENEFEGIELKIAGRGCKLVLNTIAFANCRGIERVQIVKVERIVMSLLETTEVLVILESIIQEAWFLAIDDMMLPLLMINEEDVSSYRSSFDVNKDLVAREYSERADLLDHYYSLLRVRDEFHHPSLSTKNDNGDVYVHFRLDRRMLSFVCNWMEKLDVMKNVTNGTSTATEYKVVDGRTWKAIKSKIPLKELCSFQLQSVLEGMIGPSALWAPRNLIGGHPFHGDLLDHYGATYKIYVFDRKRGHSGGWCGGSSYFSDGEQHTTI